MAGSKPRSKAVIVISPIGPSAATWEGCAGLVDGAPRTTAARIIVNAKIVPMPVNAAK